MEQIGGGQKELVEVQIKGKKTKLWARMNLWGTDLGVVMSEGAYQGYIIVARWEEASGIISREKLPLKRIERWRPSWLKRMLLPSLYDAYRQTLHILHQYGEKISLGESNLMLQAHKEAKELNLAILGLRKVNVRDYEARLRQRVETLIQKTGGEAREINKKEALEYLNKLKLLRDKSGKVSETVKMSEAYALMRRFDARLHEGIFHILPVIVTRHQVLKLMLEIIRYYLRSAEDFLKKLLELKEKIPDEDWQRQRLALRLQYLAFDLERIDLNPFRSCQWCAEEMQKAGNFFYKREDAKALSILRTSFFSLRMKRIQENLERFILELTQLLWRIEEKPQIAQTNIFSPLQFRLRRIMEDLSTISEENFRKPVLASVNTILGEGMVCIEKKNTLLLPQLKDLLKAASHLM